MGVFSHFFPIITLALYILASGLYFCALFSDWKLLSTKNATKILSLGFLFHLLSGAAQLSHDFEMSRGIFAVKGFESRFSSTLFVISCFLIASFLIFRRRFQIEKLGVFISPIAVMFFLSSGILVHFQSNSPITSGRGYLLWFHIWTITLGHVAFVFAFSVSVALILQEFLIKKRLLFKLQRQLPALVVLDELNAKCLSLGFLLMLFGVLTGVYFSSYSGCLLYTSPSPRDQRGSRMPSSA